MTDNGYHEPETELSERDRDYHRALKSLMEEIEAVDWYHQRAAMCGDDALRPILEHNRDEEIEHAAMVLEWLRRSMPGWSPMLEKYLFTRESIVGIEASEDASAGSLGIGSVDKARTR